LVSLADSIRSFKKMLIGVGLTELPEGCVPGGLYGIFNAQQMKLITDYMFIRSVATVRPIATELHTVSLHLPLCQAALFLSQYTGHRTVCVYDACGKWSCPFIFHVK